jgi:hypothetical protein
MYDPDTDPQLYQAARKRVKKRNEFYSNLISWLIVSAFLFAINIITSTEHIWALYPFLGWGLGVAFHGFETFGVGGFGKDIEERKIQKEMDRMQQSGQGSRRYLSEAKDDEDQLELKELPKKEKRTNYREEDLV